MTTGKKPKASSYQKLKRIVQMQNNTIRSLKKDIYILIEDNDFQRVTELKTMHKVQKDAENAFWNGRTTKA